MKVSVIIPTYNGATKLPVILDAVLKQNYEPGEIIVVVDGSTDNTTEILQRYSNENHILRAVYQENKGRSAVRNRGAKEATGDLLVFLDDDMQPVADCLEQHIKLQKQFANSIIVGSQIDPLLAERTDFQKFKHFLSLKWAEDLMGYDTIPIPASKTYITAANFSVSKKVFEALGGFDERLTDAEDYDLAVRAQKAGVPVYYNHKAFAWHYDNVTCRSYIKRMRQYAVSHDVLVSLKPDIHGAKIKYDKVMPKGIKKMIYHFFCSNWWINSVDKGFWKWLPQTIRYKLYEIIITANGTFFPATVLIK